MTISTHELFLGLLIITGLLFASSLYTSYREPGPVVVDPLAPQRLHYSHAAGVLFAIAVILFALQSNHRIF